MNAVRGLVRIHGRHDDRVDLDRVVRDDQVELLARLLRADDLVLVRDEDVALAAQERVQRVTRRRVLDEGVGEHLLDVVEARLPRPRHRRPGRTRP